MNRIVEILMTRDGYTQEESEEILDEMRHDIFENNHNPDDVLLDYQLEPDYFMDLI